MISTAMSWGPAMSEKTRRAGEAVATILNDSGKCRQLREKSHKLRCCDGCGRDTTSKSGLCFRCRGRGPFAEQINDNRDRSLLGPCMMRSEELGDGGARDE